MKEYFYLLLRPLVHKTGLRVRPSIGPKTVNVNVFGYCYEETDLSVQCVNKRLT